MRPVVSLGGKQRAIVSAERNSPAETALVRTRSDPQSSFGGRSEQEQNIVLQQPALGGTDIGRSGLPGLREQAREAILRGEMCARRAPMPPGPGPDSASRAGPIPAPGPTPGPGPVPTAPRRRPRCRPTGAADAVDRAGAAVELTWTGAPFTDVDLEVARGDGEVVVGGPFGTPPPPPVCRAAGATWATGRPTARARAAKWCGGRPLRRPTSNCPRAAAE
jgi:hypothetical protein